MRKAFALSISILILSLSLVSAAGKGGINESIDLENSGISAVSYADIFQGGDGAEDFIISVQLENESNVSLVRVSTQICVNSGLCYPPETQDMIEDNESGIWSAAVAPMNDQTYVNWNFVLVDGENETKIPETGFGWKVWSDCWFDGENWGGPQWTTNGDEGCQLTEEISEKETGILPSVGVIGTLAVLVAAVVIRRD